MKGFIHQTTGIAMLWPILLYVAAVAVVRALSRDTEPETPAAPILVLVK